MLQGLLNRAELSRIELIHDNDGDTTHHWFKVAIELPDNEHLQTMEITVNYDPEHKTLKEVLRSMNWNENFPVQNFNNQTGQWF
jgi:hypothetical protein